MAISVKSKFVRFLRGLVSPTADRATASPTASNATAPMPGAKPVPGSPALKSAAAPKAVNLDEIELPLAPVVANLSIDLKAKLIAAAPVGQMIHLPVETVISQLAFGTVKISFGELRHLAPGIFVNSGGELDSKLVSLPLQEILTRVNPALLARRAAKKVEVSSEIVGPFAERGRGFMFTTQPLKGPAAPPRAPEPASGDVYASSLGARQVTPPPMAPQIPQRSITPAPALPPNGINGTNGTNGNSHSHPMPVTSLSPRSITPAPNGGTGSGHGNGISGAGINGNGHGNGSNGNGKSHGLSLPPGLRLGSLNGSNGSAHADVPAAPLKMPAAPNSPAPSAPLQAASPSEPLPPAIFATLGALCENWPAELKNEILNSALAQVSVPLDGTIVMSGLKRGRVIMPWQQLRQLAQPASAPSPSDKLELELPLKVIAPLFFEAQKKQSRPQIKASVSSDIPDLFFGFPQPAAAPVAPLVPALAAPVIPAMLKLAEQKVQDTNFYALSDKAEVSLTEPAPTIPAVQTDFMTRQAHPKDVVARAAALPGVAGSVVALQDGLRVASQVPAELNADTLAAFLPQIFERVSQSTRELRMGALNNINFTVGNVPWKIFRVNAVYFAAFGSAGEQLPTAQLAQLAVELDRKKQQ